MDEAPDRVEPGSCFNILFTFLGGPAILWSQVRQLISAELDLRVFLSKDTLVKLVCVVDLLISAP